MTSKRNYRKDNKLVTMFGKTAESLLDRMCCMSSSYQDAQLCGEISDDIDYYDDDDVSSIVWLSESNEYKPNNKHSSSTSTKQHITSLQQQLQQQHQLLQLKQHEKQSRSQRKRDNGNIKNKNNHPINFPSSASVAEMCARHYPEKSFDTSNKTYDTGATTIAVMNCPSSPDRSTSTATTASLRTNSPSHGESTDCRSIDNFSNNAFVEEKKSQQVRLNEISIPRNWSWSEPTEITSNAHYERSIRHTYSDFKSFEEELSYLSVTEGYRR